ncbi:MAG TPA: efflux RND transporter periplasmic adaptor subunit [Bryobacteraceae bacterium]|nr:efflux RND transporter periplasmic adaptor subunit [Bryobacteraceae bacterium]
MCAAAVVIAAAALLLSGRGRLLHLQQVVQAFRDPGGSAGTPKAPPPSINAASPANSGAPALDLSPTQLGSVKIAKVGTYEFPVERETVGTISFADDLSVPVYPAYQGTIMNAFVELGSQVQKDQPLYTIKSPDLIQAESTLIGAAAQFDLTNKELNRVKGLPGVAQREVEQAISDEQTADGALKAARDAVRVFGKTDAEIDQMIASRKIDPALVVHSPIAGEITQFEAPLGLMVQPGNPPAPYTVSNVTVKWMLANVSESDIALLHVGEPVQVNVVAYPKRVFRAKVSKIYPMVDPNTHRATVRSEIEDPDDELRPGMFANFVIRVEGPTTGTAIAANGVVREPDGTMTAWVTTDRHHFEQRTITIGLRRDDRVQVLSGLRPGELVVTDGAVFLSSMLSATDVE